MAEVTDDRDLMTDEEEEERRRRLEALAAPTRLAPVGAPTVPAARTVAAEAPAVERLQPVGVDALSSTSSLGETPRLQPLSYAERQRLSTVSPGAPAGSAASDRAQIEKIEDQRANPWGSPENHPGFGGRLAHVFAKAGNIAGDIVAPVTMANIPGTEMHRDLEEQRLKGEEGRAETRESEGNLRSAQAEKDRRQPDKYAFHYQGQNGETFAVRPDGTVEELPAGAQKPAMKIMPFTTMGTDGKPQNQMVIVNEQKMQGIKPANGQNFTLQELQAAGAVSPLNMGEAAAKPGTAKPTYKMVPVDADHEQLNVFQDPTDPTKGTPIGAVSKKGALQVWTNPNDPAAAPKLFDPKSGALHDMPAGTQTGGALPPGGAYAEIRRTNQFNTQYVKPATDIEQNFAKFQEALREYEHDPQTGAASMVALAQHLGSTFGSVKGAQMGEHMIAEHKDAIGLFDSIGRFFDQIASGQQLSAKQWHDFNGLLTKTREIQWDTTAKEAERRNMPIDMVPADIKLDMYTPAGKTLKIAGNRIQEAERDGLKLVR
jgi:hypothetical protein